MNLAVHMHPPWAVQLQQLQRVLHGTQPAQVVLQGAMVGPTMAEGMHVQCELESIARTQRRITAHKLELERMEQFEQGPYLWPALPPGDLSAAAVIQERHLQLYAAAVDYVCTARLVRCANILLCTSMPCH